MGIKNIKDNFFNAICKLINPDAYIKNKNMLYPISFHPVEQMITTRSSTNLTVLFEVVYDDCNYTEIVNLLKLNPSYEHHGRFIIDTRERKYNKFRVILFDKESVKDYVAYASSNLREFNLSDCQLINFQVTKILCDHELNHNELKNAFPSHIFGKNFFRIFTDIVPSKAIAGNPPKIYDIKHVNFKWNNKISHITIHTNPINQITSVLLNGKHPNAEESGSYCLGKLRFSQLDVSNMNKLIDTIKVYNLTSCYFYPNELKYLLE